MKTFFAKGNDALSVREAKINSLLSDKDNNQGNVVGFYGCSTEKKEVKFIMEYMPTDWDKNYYKSSLLAVSVKERAKVYRNLLEKIKFMHDNGVLHCDIKPNNIFSDDNDLFNFRLGDFGLSKVKSEDVPYKCSRGSIYYIAPEINKASIS